MGGGLTLASWSRQAIPRPHWARRLEPGDDWLAGIDTTGRLTMASVRGAFCSQADLVVPAGAGGPCRRADRPLPGAGGPGADGAASVLLIRRATHLRANPGEIAFPGGRIEPGESPLDAALREAERGGGALGRGRSRCWVSSRSCTPPRREVPIRPFVAALAGDLGLEANRDEVDCVLSSPWTGSWRRGGTGASSGAVTTPPTGSCTFSTSGRT